MFAKFYQESEIVSNSQKQIEKSAEEIESESTLQLSKVFFIQKVN